MTSFPLRGLNLIRFGFRHQPITIIIYNIMKMYNPKHFHLHNDFAFV